LRCGLCKAQSQFFQEVSSKKYFQCQACGLVFLDPTSHVTATEELAQYSLHQNNPQDLNYRKFLAPAHAAVVRHIAVQSKGIDFGCGPGPTLSVMLEETGFKVQNFDKYFYPDRSVLGEVYDFVTCTEVIEHVHDLEAFILQLLTLLRPGGLLVLMTRILQEDVEFKSWHYRIDPTHISFLRPRTVEVMCERYGLTLLELTGQLIVLRKGQ
jgi:2-polyprenyl-3-methyl-5-hydroxy-6-metoxy-1,4-benzoquinol methylase